MKDSKVEISSYYYTFAFYQYNVDSVVAVAEIPIPKIVYL